MGKLNRYTAPEDQFWMRPMWAAFRWTCEHCSCVNPVVRSERKQCLREGKETMFSCRPKQLEIPGVSSQPGQAGANLSIKKRAVWRRLVANLKPDGEEGQLRAALASASCDMEDEAGPDVDRMRSGKITDAALQAFDKLRSRYSGCPTAPSPAFLDFCSYVNGERPAQDTDNSDVQGTR